MRRSGRFAIHRPSWLGALILVGVVGCAAREAPIAIDDAWSPPSPPGAPAVVYLRIRAREADVLLAAATPIARRTEMHTTVRTADGMMQMQPLLELAIASGQTVRFEPGGHHFMLMELESPQGSGASFPMTLKFANAGDIAVSVAVRERGSEE